MSLSDNGHELIELVFPGTFDQTLVRVTQAIEDFGLKIFTLIDHTAGAAAV